MNYKQPGGSLMRIIISLLAFAQIGFGVYLLAQGYLASSDAAGEAMSQGFGVIALIAALLFNIPALLLATINRLMTFALALVCVCPILAAWLIWAVT